MTRFVLVLAALLVASPAFANADVYLLRGGFDVFSNGLDDLAGKLRRRGVKAKSIGYARWRDAVGEIRRSGRKRVVLVGHSWGANAAVRMARELQRHGVRVSYLGTFAATGPSSVPSNVRRVRNYYQSNGWGKPLRPEQGFRGRIDNRDVRGARGVGHYNIEKQATFHKRMTRDILRALGR